MVCRICKRALEHHIDKSGAESWHHHEQDILAGHKPIPATQEEVDIIGRCDFCNQDLGAEKYILPARDFVAGVDPRSGRDIGYAGDWMACGTCAPLIDGNRWSALLRRVKACWEADHGVPAPEAKKVGWAHLYRLLRKNISGSLRRA